MTEIEINCIPLPKKCWNFGVALDYHTKSSRLKGYDKLGKPQYDNEYTILGECVNKLKYRGKIEEADKIAKIASDYIKNNLKGHIDYIIPVPPSDFERGVQPVRVVVEKISEYLSIPVSYNLRKIKKTPKVIGISDYNERFDKLKDSFQIKTPKAYFGKRILVIDDIYESGSTFTAITNVLKKEGQVKSVYVLAITKKRVYGH